MNITNRLCSECGEIYEGTVCPSCTVPGGNDLAEAHIRATVAAHAAARPKAPAFMVDLVSDRTFPLTAPTCAIGRDPANDIVIEGDGTISRFHCLITLADGEFYLEDQESRNGTYLNGARITLRRKLSQSDLVRIGLLRMRFVVPLARKGTRALVDTMPGMVPLT